MPRIPPSVPPPPLSVLRRLPGLGDLDRVEPLRGGFSGDDVFLAVARDGSRSVLRLCAPERLERKRSEARLLATLRERGLRCPDPIAVGVVSTLGRCYTVSSYTEGVPARDEIRALSPHRQREAGRAAGQQLQIVHDCTPPLAREGWQARRRAKHEGKVQALRARALRFDGQAEVDRYLTSAWPLLESSPFRLQHDDFQLGNLILANGRYAGVIDFGNWDGGDPVEDFYKVPWLTSRSSPAFARGMADGYLEAAEPERFWRRYNLFVALSLYSSLLWGAQTGAALETFPIEGDDALASWRAGIAHVIATHDFAGGEPPAWFARTPG